MIRTLGASAEVQLRTRCSPSVECVEAPDVHQISESVLGNVEEQCLRLIASVSNDTHVGREYVEAPHGCRLYGAMTVPHADAAFHLHLGTRRVRHASLS